MKRADSDLSANEKQAQVIENRRLMYAFLSRMYEKEISLDLLRELLDERNPFLKSESLELAGDEKLSRGFETLKGYLKVAARRDLNQVKLELAVEYANLFLGIKRKPPHPSESLYTSQEQSMYQEPRDRVLSSYWEAGVDKTKEYREPEDHIAIELQFMEYLCRKTVEAIRKGEREEAVKYLEFQDRFVGDHLTKWVPQLVSDILESAEVDFYKAIGEITDAFIAIDEKAVAGSLNEMRNTVTG